MRELENAACNDHFEVQMNGRCKSLNITVCERSIKADLYPKGLS